MSVANYLLLYNIVCAVLWACVFARLAVLYPLVGFKFVAEGMSGFLSVVQSLAILEIIHALLGFVRSPLLTTVMQVASRMFLIFIVNVFPSAAQSPAFSTMVLAWSVTEVIRYSYYAFNIARNGLVPAFLVWLRYNAFFVLYPLGVGSEVIVAFLSISEAEELSAPLALLIKVVLVIYIPGFYVLFTHMISQRRRVLKNLGKRKAKKDN